MQQDTLTPSNQDADLEQPIWNAALVPTSRRFEILPRLFGERFMIKGELTVYNFMSGMCSSYTGGFWDFYELPNGASYLVPTMAEHFDLSWHGNGFEGRVSADAAGIIVTLCALSAMSFHDETGTCADNFHLLSSALDRHPEAVQIFRAID